MLRIGSIVIRCKKFDKMLAFWQEALHYVLGGPAEGGFAILRDPKGKGPSVSLDKDPEEKRVGSTWRPRLHLDLYTDDQKCEVKRLLGIGATRHQQNYDPQDDFVVLEDPDGNLFCVVQT